MVSGRKIDEEFGNARTLDGDATEIRAAIPEMEILGTMSLQPFEIFSGARCVDDEQKFLLADSVGNQIINDSATFVQQKCVLTGANFQLVHIICEHLVEPIAGTRPRRYELAHV